MCRSFGNLSFSLWLKNKNHNHFTLLSSGYVTPKWILWSSQEKEEAVVTIVMMSTSPYSMPSKLHWLFMKKQKHQFWRKYKMMYKINASQSGCQMPKHNRSSLHCETVFEDTCVISTHHCGTVQVPAEEYVELHIFSQCPCEFPLGSPVSSHFLHARRWTCSTKSAGFKFNNFCLILLNVTAVVHQVSTCHC